MLLLADSVRWFLVSRWYLFLLYFVCEVFSILASEESVDRSGYTTKLERHHPVFRSVS